MQTAREELVRFCSRRDRAACRAPCAWTGLGSSLLFGQVTPFKTTFGYCSLHGHYRPRRGTVLHALQIGATGFSLKLVNGLALRACFLLTKALLGGASIAMPEWLREALSRALVDPVGEGVVRVSEVFATALPVGLVASDGFTQLVTHPLVEELFFRGFVSTGASKLAGAAVTPLLELLQRLGIFEGDLSDRAKLERYVFLVTQLTTATVFSAAHGLTHRNAEHAFYHMVFTFWEGLAMQVLQRQHGLAFTTVAHFTNNLLANVAGGLLQIP